MCCINFRHPVWSIKKAEKLHFSEVYKNLKMGRANHLRMSYKIAHDQRQKTCCKDSYGVLKSNMESYTMPIRTL